MILAGSLATCYSRLGGWLLLWLKTLASNACFAFAGCSRASGRVPCAGCLLALAHCNFGDLPSCFGSEVSCGVWRLLCAGPSSRHFALGLDSVAGRPLLRGAAKLNGSSVPHGHETVSETGHFCALHIIPVRWPLLCAGPRPCHFCAGVGLCSGPALTTQGRHTQRLVCPT